MDCVCLRSLLLLFPSSSGNRFLRFDSSESILWDRTHIRSYRIPDPWSICWDPRMMEENRKSRSRYTDFRFLRFSDFYKERILKLLKISGERSWIFRPLYRNIMPDTVRKCDSYGIHSEIEPNLVCPFSFLLPWCSDDSKDWLSLTWLDLHLHSILSLCRVYIAFSSINTWR